MEFALLFLVHLCQTGHPMVRRGWTHLEVPNGWVQLIRRRPKVQWPRAHDRKPQAATASDWRSTSGNRSSQEGFEQGVGQAREHSTGKGSCWSVGKCSQGPRLFDPAAASLQEALKKHNSRPEFLPSRASKSPRSIWPGKRSGCWRLPWLQPSKVAIV